MIKHLQKIGNSRGIVIDKSFLDLLNVDPNGAFEVTTRQGGLFLKPLSKKYVYEHLSKKHRKSLDKLGQ